MFSAKEAEYLKAQRLARVATVSTKGQPDVVPVGYEFDGKQFWVGGGSRELFLQSVKYRNVVKGNTKVALVVDDVESASPPRLRQVKVYGVAEAAEHDGRFGPGTYIRITPSVSWSFGIEAPFSGYPKGREKWRHKVVHAKGCT